MSKIQPQPGDIWTFKVPDKRRKTKEVGSVVMREFVIQRGTYPDWKDKTERLPYVEWRRENKGRYTGITVRRLIAFGQLVSTKAERDAHFNAQIERARAKRRGVASNV